MTITPTQVGDVLAKCAWYSADRTPQVGQGVVMAWCEHFAEFPHIDIADALDAVTRFHREPHERMVQPADISRIARDIIQERNDRQTDAERKAREDAWDAELLARNRERLAELINPVAEDKVVPPLKFTRPSQRNDDKPNPLAVRCPWCHAPERRPCRIPNVHGEASVTLREPHPSRVEAVQ